MAETPDNSIVPEQASPARRVFHTLIAIAGWALFIYWWWLVVQHVSRQEITSRSSSSHSRWV